MKKQTKYSSDFKLQVVKEYLTSDLSLADIASKFDIPSVNTVHRWVKLYTDSGYNDDVFNSKKGRPKSIISDISKVPPFIYESAGITKDS
ncbi:MAG: transposase [Thermosipho sp. (in: thermotogales)]|nr:transposase [Thermosipho sp. (in: thermotogales)]